MRFMWKLLVMTWLLAGAVWAAFTAEAQNQKLNLFIWSEYLDPAVTKDFEQAFHCKVVVDVYEDAESMLSKLQGGGVSRYDVVVPPDHLVPSMIHLKLLAPLRLERIPNLKNLESKFLNPPYDPGNRFSVAYQWGTVGVYARRSGGKPIDETWGIFFDRALQPGPIALIDSSRDQIGMALKYRGHSLNSTDLKQLREARDLIVEAKKRAVSFEGSVGGKNRVLAKTARAVIVYSGEAGRGMAEDPDTYYFIPREGSQIWVDNLAIPAKAPNRDLAESFVNYMLDGKVGARVSNFTMFSSPNRAAKEFIKPESLKNPVLYPDETVMKKLEFLLDLGANTKLFDEIWTHVKSK